MGVAAGVRAWDDRGTLIVGGWCGVAATLVYLLSQVVPLAAGDGATWLEPRVLFALVGGLFGPLSIVNSFAVYRLIAWERQGAANRLALLFSIVGFALVTAMLLIQGALDVVVEELPAFVEANPSEVAPAVLAAGAVGSAVDLGLDVAWDVFIAWSFAITGWLMLRHSRLGVWWGVPAIVLGAALYVLNLATYPWPPASVGLVDVGPAMGLYGLLLSGYLVHVGRGTPVGPAGEPPAG